MLKSINLTLIAIIILIVNSNAQFIDVAGTLGISNAGLDPYYGSGLSCYDYDKDGWDDLTLAANNDAIKVYHNMQGQYFELAISFPNTADAKHPIWVDYDNDGDADFFCSRYMSSCLLYRNDGDNTFVDVSENLNLPSLIAQSYGCSWGDYDNDSYPDLYVCNYDLPSGILNWLFHNNGDGTFTEVGQLMGVAGSPATSFASTWFDYDQDDDIDLFYVNDHSFGNGLFVNNNDTSFVDVSETSGAVFPLNGMSSTVRDYDNDGDQDIYITNTEVGNVLLKNNNGVYQNVIAGTNLNCFSMSWGSIWLDYNNDCLSDMYVANVSGVDYNQNYFFVNDGATFQEMPVSFMNDFNSSFCVAGGDFDNNGRTDLATSNAYPVSVSYWKNNNTQNHWLKVGLTGTASNKDAIGATMRWYADGHSCMRQKFCGENFMGQNSQYEILAMDDALIMDSLIINWPSGWVDKFYGLNADQFYSFIEGETLVQESSLPEEVFICDGDSILLSPTTAQNFVWQNGLSNMPLWVNEPGEYQLTLINDFGLTSDEIIFVSLFDNPSFQYSLTNPTCHNSNNASVEFSVFDQNESVVFWNDELISDSILMDLSAGENELVYVDQNGCRHSEVVLIESPEPFVVESFADSICSGAYSSPLVLVSGGVGDVQLSWTQQNESGEWMEWTEEGFTEGVFAISVLDENACVSSDTLTISAYDEMIVSVFIDDFCAGESTEVELEISGGTAPYELDWDEANPEEMYPGSYSVLVTDVHNCYQFIDVSIPEVLPLMAEILVTNATGGENGSMQVNAEGGQPPYSFTLNGGSVSDFISGLGQNEYQILITDAAGCTYNSVVNILDTYVSNSERKSFTCYPNPLLDVLHITMEQADYLNVFDASGNLIHRQFMFALNTDLDTRSWAAGSYIIQCGCEHQLVLKN